MICARCGKETNIHRMSYLNLEEICPECEEQEKKHPVYKYGKEIERAAVMAGNYNFPGVLEGVTYRNDAEANLLARLKHGDSVENIYEAWDNLVNSFNYDAAKFAKTMKDNGINYKEEAISWIAQMSILGRIDGRNEAAQKACKDVGIESATLTPLTKKMSRNHPTIQQQYTATMLSIYTGKPVSLPYI